MAVKIPKKFSKTNKTFIDRLVGDVNSDATSAFCAFPPGVSFNGQDHAENIVLMVRRHPAVFIPQMLLVVVFLISPAILGPILNAILGKFNFGLWTGSSLLLVLMGLTVAVDSFFKWFYTVNIITDQRIVDVDFKSILYHNSAEAQLERIEDVSHKPVGIFSSIFDYGDVYVQTAGTKPEFVFDSVPRPRDVQDTISDLLELKQEGKI